MIRYCALVCLVLHACGGMACSSADPPAGDVGSSGAAGSSADEASSGDDGSPEATSEDAPSSTSGSATSGSAESSDGSSSDTEVVPACRTVHPTVDALPAGTWLEVDARLDAVLPPEDLLEGVWGNTGPASIMSAWCGAAFDTVRDRLIVTGGGHWDYAGNELYAFDMGTLAWERLTDPSSLRGWSSGDDIMPDDTPPSRHTYTGILYLPPPIDRLWINGGSIYGPGPASPRTWLFDFDARAWTEVATSPFTGESTAAYDAARRRVYDNFNYHGMAFHDVDADTWTELGESPFGSLYVTPAWDPVRSRILFVGDGATRTCAIADDGTADCSELATSGATDMEGVATPGFAYDVARDVFVAWNGGVSVYVLDPESATWTEQVGAGPVPTAAAQNGTFTRWQYSECHDVFVGVNAIDEPVWIHRLQ